MKCLRPTFHPFPYSVLLCAFIQFLSASTYPQAITIRQNARTGDFPLVHANKTATIIVSAEDHKVVNIAASDLTADIERVTGKKPTIFSETKQGIDTAVIVGTLGKSAVVDAIAASGKLDAVRIRGKWESFIITTIERPLPNIKRALVIAGSDRRGTAFGVYELSRMIGVSPWYWWADVTPEKRSNLILSPGTITSREPSVKYRGIFINDEDWGLQPWAAKTFEPETGDIGPKTYAKVCELLLRLKANTLWPAMHDVTRSFNSIAGNAKTADAYAIVMGSSHAEPMLRSNTTEWKTDKNSFNFVTNPGGVTEYWEERVRENGRFENIYTIGMRGIHDSPILGTKSQAERIPLLEKIFGIQRSLIAKHVNPNVESVPQIFCPYKEVLADYRAGLKVPDDVTIVFPDDNFGYIRQFPTAEEQKRKGGFGVYYHISYLGRPLSYLWLNTTPPALIWQEMNKAYENGMRQLWIVNVGDIKPGEIGMEFFLQMAYDADRWTIDNQDEYLIEWAGREFGKAFSNDIANILREYYQLGFQRKPEHLQWYLPNETPRQSDLLPSEKILRLKRYADLQKSAETVYLSLPDSKKDAFFQLALYSVRSAANANQRFFAAEIADQPSVTWLGRANWDDRFRSADAAITADTRHFNETLAGGKWRHIMSPEMNPGQWPSMRSSPPSLSVNVAPRPLTDAESADMKDLLYLRSGKQSETLYSDANGVVSIEAEHFLKATQAGGFSWRVIKGLGKTGDSVAVLPAKAHTFGCRTAPTIVFQLDIEKAADFQAYFYLVPTQPLTAGSGLRFAFSVDDGEPRVMTVDQETEVSSRKWSQNVLDQTTVGMARVQLSRGRHTLKILAVDTGVVLDKIVLASRELPTSYFGPEETRSERTRR